MRNGEWHGRQTEFNGEKFSNQIYKNSALMSSIGVTVAPDKAFYVKGKALTAHANAKMELQNNIKARISLTKDEQQEEAKQVEVQTTGH